MYARDGESDEMAFNPTHTHARPPNNMRREFFCAVCIFLYIRPMIFLLLYIGIVLYGGCDFDIPISTQTQTGSLGRHISHDLHNAPGSLYVK